MDLIVRKAKFNFFFIEKNNNINLRKNENKCPSRSFDIDVQGIFLDVKQITF
jgi:hypothetical protein